jgi:hypothetical protein
MRDVHRQNREDIYTSQRARGASAKGASWDLSATWRYRRKGAQQFLSSLERRYLKGALISLEQSGQDLTGTFPVRMLRPISTPRYQFAQPLQNLVARGLVAVSPGGKKWRGTLTQHCVSVVRVWLSTKPPDLLALFPNLYRVLDENRANDVPHARRS